MRLLFVATAIAAFGVFASVTFGDIQDAPPITIEVTTPVEATDAGGADVTYHVVSHVDLDVTCTPTGGPAMNFSATSHFPLGTSSISCTDGTNSASEAVTVQDTTPPTVSVPGGASGSTTDPSGTANVSWDPVSASDTVDGTLAASCSPTSGSAFPIGTTTVTCTATDGHGNTGSASFTVTVTFSDTTPPTIGSVSNITAEATGPGGAAVSYGLPSASDNSGVAPTVACAPPSGSTFSLGDTTVTCTATDGQGNAANTSFKITVQDTTPPTLNLPGGLAVETESPGGATVTYTASASDAVAGTITPSCTPASGSNFPLGTTHVGCTADDGHGHSVSGSFDVTVTLVDRTAPSFSGVPANITVEANGPSGSIVNYTSPTATDNLDGPIALVPCAPASGGNFPLGTTTVTCHATDGHGNTGTVSFHITVADTTAPTLAVPGPTSVYATTPTGIPETAQGLAGFRAAVSASDIVDPHPIISDNLGSFVEVGIHEVFFLARDASGNVASKATQLTVLPQPPAGTPPLPVPPPAKPPADVPRLQAFPGDGFMRLVWGAVPGAARYVLYRSESGARRLTAEGHGDVVYSGTATTYTDRGLKNGIEYRYVLATQDAAGNESAGVAIAAVPRKNLLRTPKDGAKLKKAPKFTWQRNAEATYYNLQLFRGDVKILSVWPVRPSFALKRKWKWEGHSYTLSRGQYRWYVWPGFGARADVDYGELMGSSSFQVLR